MSYRVEVPLINTNEPEANLVALPIHNGDHVEAGALICTLETTKSTVEIEAGIDGYITGLKKAEGDTVRAGELLCYIAESPTWHPPTDAQPSVADQIAGEIPGGLRITEPARSLAERHGLSLQDLPTGKIITEKTILEIVRKTGGHTIEVSESKIDKDSILIYGCGGHGKAVFELIESVQKYHVIGYLDDGVLAGEEIMGVQVLGGRERLAELRDKGVRFIVNAVGGIGNVRIRIKVFEYIRSAGFDCPTIVHPTAFIEPSAILEQGVQVFPHAYVGSEAHIAFGTIINTGAIVSHDCHLGEYVNLSPGGILAGEVHVEDGSLIGMGATVNLQVRIGASARIGNGATVKTDVPRKGIVRAGSVWPEI